MDVTGFPMEMNPGKSIDQLVVSWLNFSIGDRKIPKGISDSIFLMVIYFLVFLVIVSEE